jgi:hypothetical protein
VRIGRSNADPFAVDNGQGKKSAKPTIGYRSAWWRSAGTVTCKSAQAKKETETERKSDRGRMWRKSGAGPTQIGDEAEGRRASSSPVK